MLGSAKPTARPDLPELFHDPTRGFEELERARRSLNSGTFDHLEDDVVANSVCTLNYKGYQLNFNPEFNF